MKKEIWKNINGYEGLYIVSNFGNIKSLDRKKFNGKGFYHIKGIELKKELTEFGYHRVSLSKEGVRKYHKVHRLVAENFIANLLNKEQINHIDGNKTNNCVNNLEWCTREENMNHARVNGLCNSPITSNYIALKSDNDTIISQYTSFQSFFKATNIKPGKLIQTLNNNNVNYELIDKILEHIPTNKKLNKFINCAKYFPIAVYDENMNLLAMYTNISSMTKNTTIPECKGTEANKKGLIKYKKRGKDYKKSYYIKKISFVDFFITPCDIIDEYLVIE